MPHPPARLQLQTINNHALRYPLDLAEKDYFLGAALSLIAQSPLADVLVFKGGTAIHHCYLPQYRFSEDIDFSCRVRGGVTLDEVKAALETGGLFEVQKEFTSPATIKVERLRYAGILAQPGAIKVEIDHLQNVVLPPHLLPYRNVWGLDVVLPVMDIRDIAGEKLRAASQRARYRDFYDLYLLVEEYTPDIEEMVALLRQKEVRQPITVKQLRENWQRVMQEKSDLRARIHYSRAIEQDDITKLVKSLHFESIVRASD